ncbi:MAG: MBL fold metallo-hydrolase [Myxococcales bacterium]|nr:MBL fold metallo-hydrolase [Myxococcales bacterium]
MEITFLGTGSAFTDYRLNYHNNAVVHTDAGPVLIDCGPTALQSLRELGIGLQQVRQILVTHLHGDHIGGIEQLAWQRFYGDGDDDGPNWNRTPVCSTERVLTDLRTSLWACMDEWTDRDGCSRDGYDHIVEPTIVAQDTAFEIGGVCFELNWTPHVAVDDIIKPAFGVKVWRGEGDEVFYFTSDTTFRSDIGALYPRGAIFHDCNFAPAHGGSVHTHYSELLTLPDEVRARIVLMHHTVVPEGVDPLADGFRAAAARHDRFDWTGTRVESRMPNLS